MRIESLDARTADTATLTALHAVRVAIELELYPDDEPTPLDEFVAGMHHRPDYSVVRLWIARDDDGRAAGGASMLYDDVPENRHLADANVAVLPAYRRKGVASRLLAEVAAEARRIDRRLLQFSAREGGSGEPFVAAMGAEKKFVEHHNRLRIDDVDRARMEQWAAIAPPGYSLEVWDGGVPGADLAAFARLLDVMNDAPRGDLEMEDERNRPEQVAAWDATIAARGQEMWTIVARHDTTGTLAGWTTLLFPSVRKDVAFQLGTGVAPEHRGHGLGRWMKAVNLLRLLDERPTVRRVETENATTNEWMLAINDGMGFQSFETVGWWQVATDDVLRRVQ